ncbi:MAG TPA: endolytic transglycosylase MltG [Bdellovibrionales bacterium]|nr:endolytic transglycosylase MltG [Bdellovibrionales bacterium]
MKTALRLLSALLLVAAIGVLVLAFGIHNYLNAPASGSEEIVRFEVSPGESLKSVTRRLQSEDLIRSARAVELYARFIDGRASARVGEYAIRRSATPREILAIISSGKSIEYSISIPEGYNLFEIADVVEKQGIATKAEFLALVRDPVLATQLLGEEHTSLEGYLFPETYKYTKFTDGVALVKMMVARFKENYAKALEGVETKMTRHQIVTLASIIEKETGAPEERPLISSVFHNRLRMNMRLQTDPTVIYGVWESSGVWNKNISKKDLTTPTRYNTYTNYGLPYGPIANAGLEALRAAVRPETSEYLFFVSRNNGTHVFSKDLRGHVNAVNVFQLNKKAREGKSWRDLKKRKQ